MSLSLSLDVARNSLATTADQTSLVSRNVARAGDPNATRKSAELVTTPGGSARLSAIRRVTDAALFDKMLGATSNAASQQAIVAALDRLDQTISDPELDASPAALVQKLADALQQYAVAPQDTNRARSALAAASNLAISLNEATSAVQQVRTQADADIASSVDRMNTLLSRFETVNTEIVKGTRGGADVTDYLDQRDQILASLSEEVGIRTLTRANGDMAVFTDSGVTLFDVTARSVSFDRSLIFSASTIGNQVFADGVAITGGTGTMNVSTGRLVGLVAVRDEYAVTFQTQLDELARGLIEAFAESDQSGTATFPDAPGLFTWPGAPALPASGSAVTGLAGNIIINPNVDPAVGGNLALLRDGGIADPFNPAYTYNTTGAAGFTGRLDQILGQLSAPRAFDPTSQLATTTTLYSFSTSSVGWLEEARKTASDQAEYTTTLLERSSEALSKVTGVNLDEEMTLLLDLERSYQAASKILSTIDAMYGALLSVA